MKKARRGRPPKAPEERADAVVHVRFTAEELAVIDAYVEATKKRVAKSGEAVEPRSISRASVLRAAVLAAAKVRGRSA